LTSEKLAELQERQLQLEQENHLHTLGERSRRDIENMQKGRGSMTETARAMRLMIVPSVAKWLEHHHEVCKRRGNRTGYAFSLMERVSIWMNWDYISHIGLSCTLDSLGRHNKLTTKIGALQIKIGETIEHQAFLMYMQEVKPNYYSKLEGWYLNKPHTTYERKIGAMKHAHNKSDEFNWRFMSTKDHSALGSLVLQAVMSIRDDSDHDYIFEAIKDWDNVSKAKRKHKALYLGLTKTGMLWRETLQQMVDEAAFSAWPMLCPPNDWTNKKNGGYLTCPAPKYRNLVHNDRGTVLGQKALDAINKLQRVPYKVNRYIYDLQCSLLNKTWQIGSFVTFELESYRDHFPLMKDSDYIATLDKQSDEYKKIMRTLTKAYDKQRIDEEKAKSPRRVLSVAERFIDEEMFFIPWFSDWRGRCYSMVDTLSPQGCDYARSLILSAVGSPINDQTYRNLLINLAITGEFPTKYGIKSNKLTYDKRVEWAQEWIDTGEIDFIVEDPMSYRYWMDAEEPWQFLATCEEIVACFRKKTRDRTHVFVARDMTCSGIQIMSALIGDQEAAREVNITSYLDEVRDAYAAVGNKAQELLKDKHWLRHKLHLREEKRVKWNKSHPDEKQREFRDGISSIPIDKVDRKLSKLATLVAGYGGTFASRSEGVYKAAEEAGIELHPADKPILALSIIEGMDYAFPKMKELNDWLVNCIKLAMQKVTARGEHDLTWITPQCGTVVHQSYREPLCSKVRTAAASGGHYARLVRDAEGYTYFRDGWGDTIIRKHCSGGPANLVHSLDADLLCGCITNTPEIPLYTVHDCLMATASDIEDVAAEFRRSFYRTLSSDFLQALIDHWGIGDQVQVPEKGEYDLTECLQAIYMTS
jgi:DNA-directed RNA polymerase